MEFRDFYELATKVTEYEELIKEKSNQRKKSMRTYCQEVNQEVVVENLSIIGTFTCLLLVEKAHDLWKKEQIVDTQVQYTFEVAKTEEIFDFLVKEKFITFIKDHQTLNKDELRGNTYYKHDYKCHDISMIYQLSVTIDTIFKVDSQLTNLSSFYHKYR